MRGVDGRKPQFGQILHFVNIFDGHTTHNLAKIEWMPMPVLDVDSLLWKVNVGTLLETSFVSVKQLPPSLVTAVDDADKSVIWILDFNESFI